jgi:protoporphyrinogen oxidase/glycosyltransferase involved in cell wall biosynthesis
MSTCLIVFSHLRWNFVFQRPQHLMTRLARQHGGYFVEEPIPVDDGPAYLELTDVAPNVRVVRPHTPIRAPGFHDEQLRVLQRLVADLMTDEGIEDHAVWFYTPMALPFAQSLNPTAVVYDCMDELSAFLNAPKQLLQRERALLKAADVVFTGGPSLYRAKKDRHPAVHCFPSSVDARHFERALEPGTDHPAQATLPHPRLGYYGVIDERLDLDLIAAVADAQPDWQVVMVGPVVKIDPASLPRRPNIHYLGQHAYDELPAFIGGWDVCLLPFARNESTRYISPTKTLEYMAAGKPVVGTPITDVAEPYGDLVRLGDGAAAFVAACREALELTPAAREALATAMRARAATTSWDDTADRMNEILGRVRHERRRTLAASGQAATTATDGAVATAPGVVGMPLKAKPRGATPAAYDTVVVGAGPTGLSAAYHLGRGSLLLDQNPTIGGWCRSIVDHGFTFDYAGHIMFSNDPYVHELYRKLLGDNVHWQDREAWIYSKNVYTRYPFQGALYGLPPDVLKECIIGAIEARFGSVKADKPRKIEDAVAKAASSSPSQGKAESITDDLPLTDCCADGIAACEVELADSPSLTLNTRSNDPRNFEEFIYKVWGAGVAKHFAIPYNRKLWAVPLTEMETSWLGGRVPLPDLEEMIDGALRPVAKPQGPNARFGYPLKGGFQALMDGFLPLLKGDMRLNAKVTKVVPSRHEVHLADGSTYRYRQLISTMPLTKLVEMIGGEAPPAVHLAAKRLRHVSVRCVNIGVARENVTEKHWIYYPEDTVFHRIFVQGNASPHCNPPGGFGITCEITYAPTKPLPCDGEELIDLCIRDCIRVGLLREDDVVLARNQVDMPYAYVVYDHARRQAVETIREFMTSRDIVLVGRYSEWEYYNSDHAFLAGRKGAERAREALEFEAAGRAGHGASDAAQSSAGAS